MKKQWNDEIPYIGREPGASPILAKGTRMRPLEGITVVSLEHAIAAPFCTRQLADLGARVIKVERPGAGDFARSYDTRVHGLSSHFVWVNRSKESLALDLKSPEDLDVLYKLLEVSDVFVQNLAPGAADRLGLTRAFFEEHHPALIVCNISGYGEDGPYRNKKAYDLLIQSEAGFLSVTGYPEDPVKAGCSISDIAAGMYSYSNILAALLNRSKTGVGCWLDISMLECTVEWMGFPLYYAIDGQSAPIPAGASHASIFPYGPFRTGDGNSVMLGVQNEREWKNFCSVVLSHPGLAVDARFDTNSKRCVEQESLKDIILECFNELSACEITERLDAAGIANANVNDMQAVWKHPQLSARGRWTEVESPIGPIPALYPAGVPKEFSPKMDPIPRVGEHNSKIFAELGINRPEETAKTNDAG